MSEYVWNLEAPLAGLDDRQAAAVSSGHPRRVVLAGPGSGKTRLLVAAVCCHLMREGGPVVVVAYTNAAALEVKERLQAAKVGGVGFVGTLHSFCLKLLLEHHELAGLPAGVVVVDDQAKAALLETVARDMGATGCNKRRLREAVADYHPIAAMQSTIEGLVAREYHSRLLRDGLVDYEGLLWYGLQVVQELADRNEWPYRGLFVDEFQDAAGMDQAIYHAMPCVAKVLVGDSDQAIFSFRGGDVSHLLRLAGGVGPMADRARAEKSEVASPGSEVGGERWEVHTLQSNYRCEPAVCSAANRLIRNNRQRVEKWTLRPMRLGGVGDVRVAECQDDAVERVAVVSWATRWEEPASLAVLARTNRVADWMADALRGAGVLVRLRAAADLPYDWAKAKALLRVLADPWKDFLVYQYIRDYKGEGVMVDADDIRRGAAAACKGINEFLGYMFGKGDASDVTADIDLGRLGVSVESRTKVHNACCELSKLDPSWTLRDLLLYLPSTEHQPPAGDGGVVVSTIHGVKGMEFDEVWVAGCEEGLFPTGGEPPYMIEEERRLMFVALTRARRSVTMSWCRERHTQYGLRPTGVSRFVVEATDQKLAPPPDMVAKP